MEHDFILSNIQIVISKVKKLLRYYLDLARVGGFHRQDVLRDDFALASLIIVSLNYDSVFYPVPS